MKVGPRLASLRLFKILGLNDAPRESIDVLTSIIEAENWANSRSSAEEKAETWNTAFKAYLQTDISELNRLGRFCFFAFNSSAESQVQGASYIEPSDSAELQAEKISRGYFQSYVEALRCLSARELELLCAGLLELLHVSSPLVTKYSADRGVDFFGKLHIDRHIFSTDSSPGWHKQLSVWLVGQAKHYVDGTVSTPALRDLVGTVALLRGIHADRRAYPNLLIRPCDSVFHLLVTTGRMSSEVWKEIDRSGVVGIDGEMLAAFLAARSIGSVDGTFKPSSLLQWISAFETYPTHEPDSEADATADCTE